MAAAVLRAPDYLSEISSENYERLRVAATPPENLERVAELSEQDKALDTALKALDTADRKVNEIVDLGFRSRKESGEAGAAEAEEEIEAEEEKAAKAAAQAERDAKLIEGQAA